MNANTTTIIEAVNNGFIVRLPIEHGMLVSKTLVFETRATLLNYIKALFDEPKDAKVETK